MILIADAGSTKTDWVRADDGGVYEFFSTPGINPTHMPPGDMAELLREGLPNRWKVDVFVERIVFYGAGCGNPKGIQRMEDALRAVFPYAEIEIYTDILGAARALWGREAGMACILGTGANAGYYDGKSVFTHPSLGYLLGDEASGASLGKAFLKMYLRGSCL
jgi:Predicted N-acetylglucosamine kinase